MSLSLQQLSVLSFVAVVIVQVVKLLAARLNKPLSRRFLTWLSLVVAAVFGLFWSAPDYAAFSPPGWDAADPAGSLLLLQDYINGVVFVILQAVAFVIAVYKALAKEVFRNLKLSP